MRKPNLLRAYLIFIDKKTNNPKKTRENEENDEYQKIPTLHVLYGWNGDTS